MRILQLSLGIVLVAACAPTCPEGTRAQGDRCVDVDRDASLDAATDAETDGQVRDSGPYRDMAMFDARTGDGCVVQMFWPDRDADGYGDPASPSVMRCGAPAPANYVDNDDDCDDTTSARYPGKSELCDGLDNDCNGPIDDGLARSQWYDGDEDGYGNADEMIMDCMIRVHYVENSNDCDDGRAAVHPMATEVCNGLDDDCDSATDEEVLMTFYPDSDHDNHGAMSGAMMACSAPANYVSSSDDCNDAVSTTYPSATELCNAVDDNCDGMRDNRPGVFECVRGESSRCATTCDTWGTGLCKNTCLMADPVDCTPPAETCNGTDDNCDGIVDGELPRFSSRTDTGLPTDTYQIKSQAFSSTYGSPTMTGVLIAGLTNTNDVYIQRLKSDGTLSSAIKLTISSDAYQFDLSYSGLRSEALVTWVTTVGDVYVAKINVYDWTQTTTEKLIYDGPTVGLPPDVHVTNFGATAWITWMTSSGNIVGDTFDVTTLPSTTSPKTYIDRHATGYAFWAQHTTGGHYIFYTDTSPTSTDEDLYVARVNVSSGGITVGPRILEENTVSDSMPIIAERASGVYTTDLVLAWSRDNQVRFAYFSDLDPSAGSNELVGTSSGSSWRRAIPSVGYEKRPFDLVRTGGRILVSYLAESSGSTSVRRAAISDPALTSLFSDEAMTSLSAASCLGAACTPSTASHNATTVSPIGNSKTVFVVAQSGVRPYFYTWMCP